MDEMTDKLAALRTADWWTRKRAIEDIIAVPEDRYLDVLASWLRRGDDDLARNAAMEVYRALGVRATAALRGLLSDEDSDVRVFAANLIGDIGDVSALPDLGAAMKDTDVNIRMAVVEAMGKLRDERAVGLILPVMGDAPWAVMAGIHALGRIGGAEARAALHGLLTRGEYRGMTCEALERAGDCSSLEHLVQYAGRGEIGGRAVRAMVAIAERRCPKVPLDVFAGILPILMDLTGSPDGSLRQAALTALGWTRDSQAALPLIEALVGDEPLRECAINGLMALGSNAAAEIAAALRRGSPQRGVLANILSTVGDKGLLLEFAADEDSEVRTEVALALGSLQTSAAEAALKKLTGDASAEVRAAAQISLRAVQEGNGA